jgi:hypothetical protein
MKSDIRSQMLLSLGAGILAGTMNLAAAAMIFGGSVTHGFQMIASGLLGERAFNGGANTAVLGAGLHYAISIVAAALYWEAVRRVRSLRAHWLIGGATFGILAYAVMNLVVVPLSKAAGPDLSPVVVAKELVAHTIMFGIPIAGVVSMAWRGGTDN